MTLTELLKITSGQTRYFGDSKDSFVQSGPHSVTILSEEVPKDVATDCGTFKKRSGVKSQWAATAQLPTLSVGGPLDI